jgi:outer membrane protein TolC
MSAQVVLISTAYFALTSHLTAKFGLFVGCMSLALGLQNGAFSQAGGISVHTTYLTGMITSLLKTKTERNSSQSAARDKLTSDQKVTLLAGIWLAFVLGATVGAAMVFWFGAPGVFGAALLLLAMVIGQSASRWQGAKLKPHRLNCGGTDLAGGVAGKGEPTHRIQFGSADASSSGGGEGEWYRCIGSVEVVRAITRAAILFLFLFSVSHTSAQSAPASPSRPWHSPAERQVQDEARQLRDFRLGTDPTQPYSLVELIDLAETHNPETRVAWERARAQAAALGVARSELYPTLAVAALSATRRGEIFFITNFLRQTTQYFQVTLALNYTVFDFGARSGRIDAARAEVLAANFGFNNTHRKVIYQVEQAYYRLLNSMGQEDAARASLSNAQAVQQAAEDRLAHGLATLPDVLEARSATAEAEYDLQAVLGAEEIARGDLATAVGTSAAAAIHVQPINQLPTPDSIGDTVDQAINRALEQRPDLMQRVAEIRSANARVKEARAAYYPALTLNVSPNVQSLYGLQQQFPWAHTADLAGGVIFNLRWAIFDGGARKNNLARAKANVNAAEAKVNVTQDEIADQVWTAYSNLNTAFRQRQASLALLEAASQSYAAALESYNYGVRSLLDVTAAQRTLAQARSTDVLARTQVLTALADLAFRTGDSIQPNTPRPLP